MSDPKVGPPKSGSAYDTGASHILVLFTQAASTHIHNGVSCWSFVYCIPFCAGTTAQVNGSMYCELWVVYSNRVICSMCMSQECEDHRLACAIAWCRSSIREFTNHFFFHVFVHFQCTFQAAAANCSVFQRFFPTGRFPWLLHSLLRQWIRV